MEKIPLKKTILIRAQTLTRQGFQPYGEAVMLPEIPAPKRGEAWDCWNRIAHLGEADFYAGIVKTRCSNQAIRVMERHPQVEILIPVSAAIIQALAKPAEPGNPAAQPGAHSVAAFIIQPGQAVILAPGTWHWAAMPFGKGEALYYYLTEPSLAKNNFGSWIPFSGNLQVKITVGE